MKFFLLLLCLWVPTIGEGQETPSTTSIRSRSGQFIVVGQLNPQPPVNSPARQLGLIELRPHTMAVTCERVKSSLLHELGMRDQWRGKIHVYIVPAIFARQQSVVTSTLHTDGWQYEVEVPEECSEQRLLRLLVQVILQEMANRQARERAAELPAWLIEGLTRHVQANTTMNLYVQVGQHANREGIRADPLREVRARLQATAPLSFQELSWPPDEKVSNQTWELFQLCSHLFVHELLRLPSGRASMRELLHKLPQNFNWQTSFLECYGAQFRRLLDVEKWWAVMLVNFTGRNEWQQWSEMAALEKLHVALQVTAEERVSAKELPRQTRLSLQSVLKEWDFTRQQAALRGTTQQLLQMRPLIPMELAPLVDQYRLVIENYLLKRPTTGFTTSRGVPLLRSNPLLEQTVIQLDQLDREREALLSRFTADIQATRDSNLR